MLLSLTPSVWSGLDFDEHVFVKVPLLVFTSTNHSHSCRSRALNSSQLFQILLADRCQDWSTYVRCTPSPSSPESFIPAMSANYGTFSSSDGPSGTFGR